MKLLLDTHAFLWFVEGDPQLSVTARHLIEDDNNELWLSMASLWEMAIKFSIGKLTALNTAHPFEQQIAEQLLRNDILILPILQLHVMRVASLPFHHRDPFDRLLAAQSLIEDIPLLSTDQVMDAYGVNRLW